MEWLEIVRLAIQYGPIIKEILDTATSNKSIVEKIQAGAPLLVPILVEGANKLFPKAAKEIQIAAGAIAAFDPNLTKWLQNSLNTLVKPSPNLVVDGHYGPLTRAAVEALQTQLGLKVDGVAGKITQAAITAALSLKPEIK